MQRTPLNTCQSKKVIVPTIIHTTLSLSGLELDSFYSLSDPDGLRPDRMSKRKASSCFRFQFCFALCNNLSCLGQQDAPHAGFHPAVSSRLSKHSAPWENHIKARTIKIAPLTTHFWGFSHFYESLPLPPDICVVSGS